MCKRESVVICIICEACSFNKVENVIYEYIKENWTKNWTLWHALNGGFPWTVHVAYPDTLLTIWEVWFNNFDWLILNTRSLKFCDQKFMWHAVESFAKVH